MNILRHVGLLDKFREQGKLWCRRGNVESRAFGQGE
jgi:hypothetical protein